MNKNRVKLYLSALEYLGTDASPLDEAPDELGCADSVSKIVLKTFPNVIKGSVSTRELFNQLNTSPKFKRVTVGKFGDVVISPTGMEKAPGKIKNGHVGIFGEDEVIMSNSSATGTWEANFTLKFWVARYRDLGNYPIYIFRVV